LRSVFAIAVLLSPKQKGPRPRTTWDESLGSRGSTRIPPGGGTRIRYMGRTRIARRWSSYLWTGRLAPLSGSLNGPAMERCPRRREELMIARD